MWTKKIFNSTYFIMAHQFVQNKFIQEFVVLSLLFVINPKKEKNPEISDQTQTERVPVRVHKSKSI